MVILWKSIVVGRFRPSAIHFRTIHSRFMHTGSSKTISLAKLATQSAVDILIYEHKMPITFLRIYMIGLVHVIMWPVIGYYLCLDDAAKESAKNDQLPNSIRDAWRQLTAASPQHLSIMGALSGFGLSVLIWGHWYAGHVVRRLWIEKGGKYIKIQNCQRFKNHEKTIIRIPLSTAYTKEPLYTGYGTNQCQQRPSDVMHRRGFFRRILTPIDSPLLLYTEKGRFRIDRVYGECKLIHLFDGQFMRTS